MDGKKVHGLRLFLMSLIKLIATGKSESTQYVEESIGKGIASIMAKKYFEVFDLMGFTIDSWEAVDNYYRSLWNGCADGQEGKYACEKNDGLLLLVDLALNEIY